MIEVTDNYLSPDQHKKLSNFLLKDGLCEWKFNDRKVSDKKNDAFSVYQFSDLSKPLVGKHLWSLNLVP